jgi:hypothetical protein
MLNVSLSLSLPLYMYINYVLKARHVVYMYKPHLHLQHRQHTNHEEETSNNRRKAKSLHCPQLDHHEDILTY